MNALAAAVDAGAGAGLLRLYDGVRPITGGTVTNLLVQLTFSSTSFQPASAGTITANEISTAVAAIDGTASWFRIVDSTNSFVCDGSVGEASSDLILNSTLISAGVLVEISSAILASGDA